jgi:DNA-binding response OmpR family regulator
MIVPSSDNWKVIIADRSEISAQLLKDLAKSIFSDVSIEQDAKALVAIISQSMSTDSPIRIAIINHKLSGIDGVEVTKLIRDTGYQGTIIGTSSEFTEQLKDEWTTAGCDGFIAKPILIDHLLDELSRLLTSE